MERQPHIRARLQPATRCIIDGGAGHRSGAASGAVRASRGRRAGRPGPSHSSFLVCRVPGTGIPLVCAGTPGTHDGALRNRPCRGSRLTRRHHAHPPGAAAPPVPLGHCTPELGRRPSPRCDGCRTEEGAEGAQEGVRRSGPRGRKAWPARLGKGAGAKREGGCRQPQAESSGHLLPLATLGLSKPDEGTRAVRVPPLWVVNYEPTVSRSRGRW